MTLDRLKALAGAATFAEQFDRDIDRHIMEVYRDDGVNRHVRFRRPGTMCMHFDLLTWPGYLCYTGDMGTYVFARLHDMFEFFRQNENQHQYVNLPYWAEKLQACDRGDGFDEFSADLFREQVRDYFEQATDDADEWPAPRKAALWDEIESEVFGGLEDIGEHGAWAALRGFSHEGFYFQDWERQCREYTYRYRWCCHALVWAIDQYDKARIASLAELTGK